MVLSDSPLKRQCSSPSHPAITHTTSLACDTDYHLLLTTSSLLCPLHLIHPFSTGLLPWGSQMVTLSFLRTLWWGPVPRYPLWYSRATPVVETQTSEHRSTRSGHGRATLNQFRFHSHSHLPMPTTKSPHLRGYNREFSHHLGQGSAQE